MQNLRHILKKLLPQQKQTMSEKLIRSVIGSSSLNLDPATVTDVVNFILTFVGEGSKIQIVKIYACTAIVCECKKIPSVNAQAMVHTGLTIEKIMRCIGDVPREEFFSLLYLIATKWPGCPQALYHKIDTLRTSYRIFKKYRRVCQLIGREAGLPENINGLLSSFGWLVHLTAMIKEEQIGKIELVSQIIPLLLRILYSDRLKLANNQPIIDITVNSFPPSTLSVSSQINVVSRYQQRYSAIINQVYELRGYKHSIQQYIQNPEILQRLIDDLSTQYYRFRDYERQQYIDQASFLGINRTLTPEVFMHSRFQYLNGPISQRLSFQGEKNGGFQVGTERSRNLQDTERSNTSIETPLTTKLQCLAWIRSCIQSLSTFQIEKARICYESFRSQPYQQFLQQVNLKLHKAIQTFTPTCRDYNHRKTQIFKFYTCCISTIIQMYNQQDLREIYEDTNSVLSILALCTEIFNFCYQARVGDYKQYCDIFGISLVCGFEPINWFGRFLKLPFGVSEHLFDVQRRLLLKQIWQNDNQLQILKDQAQKTPQFQQAQTRIQKRLEYHIKSRIRDICDETMGNYLTQKIFSIVQLFMAKNPTLIAEHNIDKIIICSITVTLCSKADQSTHFRIIQQVVDKYRRIPLSFQTNLNTYQKDTCRNMNIVEYYNEYFLQLLEGIMGSSHFEMPKKIQITEWDNDDATVHTGFASNTKSESVFLKKPAQLKTDIKSYQKKLAKNIFLSAGKQIPGHNKSDSSDMLDESEQDQMHSGSS